MNICILNGNPSDVSDGINIYLEELVRDLLDGGHSVQEIALRDLKIHYCTGCFGCWVKTPGECVVRDDSDFVRRRVIQSDLTLMASPLILGFPSALLKKVNDKFLPLIHPYIELVQGECHHRSRYERYPVLALLLEPEHDTDEEDLSIVSGIYQRLALNFKSRLAFTHTTETAVQEVSDEINRI